MMLSRKLLSASSASGPALPPELVWSLGDQTGYESIDTIPVPGGVLQSRDVIYVASLRDAGVSPGPAIPAGFTEVVKEFDSVVGYSLGYLIVGATPPSEISGLTSEANTTHTAFAFRNVMPTTEAYDFSSTPTVYEANGTTLVNVPAPASPYDINPMTDPVGGVAFYIGYLDDDRVFMTPPSPFISCGRSRTGTKGASIAAAYAIIPPDGLAPFGRFSGGSDDWASVISTAAPA